MTNQSRRRPVAVDLLVQHIDNRQGRVTAIGQTDGLPSARVKWFRGEEEWVPLGYIFVTAIEETE